MSIRKKLALIPEPPYRVSEVELAYKFKADPLERPIITTSNDAYCLFLNNWDDSKIDLCEEFKALYLNRGNKVLSLCAISRGGVSGTVVDERHIILGAILQNASSIILCHNHPSNNLVPSQADKDITQKIKQGAQLFNIHTLDHLIIARQGYLSFADTGLML